MHKEVYISDNPLSNFSLSKAPENLTRIITPEQYRLFLSHVDSSTPDGLKYYCILLILYDNGMRISEPVNIKISNIDFEDKT